VILCVADLGADAARRVVFGREAELQERAPDGGSLIVVIVDGEIAREAEALSFAAQESGAEGMESGDPDIPCGESACAQEVLNALLHHAGGLVGEGDGQDRAGWNTLLDQVRDAIGNDAGLARARSGQDEQRALRGKHGFALALVQSDDEWSSLRRIVQAQILAERMRLSNLRRSGSAARG
jgi:hypothetical protein